MHCRFDLMSHILLDSSLAIRFFLLYSYIHLLCVNMSSALKIVNNSAKNPSRYRYEGWIHFLYFIVMNELDIPMAVCYTVRHTHTTRTPYVYNIHWTSIMRTHVFPSFAKKLVSCASIHTHTTFNSTSKKVGFMYPTWWFKPKIGFSCFSHLQGEWTSFLISNDKPSNPSFVFIWLNKFFERKYSRNAFNFKCEKKSLFVVSSSGVFWSKK